VNGMQIAVLSGVLLLGLTFREGQAGQPGAQGREDGWAVATFAGGCFWCMEPPYDKVAGVVETTVGYTGGSTENPTYEEVSGGGTGHAEAIRVLFDPDKVGYAQLLDIFWRNVDPFDAGGQFCDRGDQYRSAIFVHTPEQEELATRSRVAVEERFGRTVATDIVPAAPFYPAEAYHQDYYQKNPLRYKFYRYGCGRDRTLRDLWEETAPAP
jgi:peptide-methionine (S)-S-oxide reductase